MDWQYQNAATAMIREQDKTLGGKQMDVRIPYNPRPHWAGEIHKQLNIHRFSVLVAHRRFGKTVGALNHLFARALKNALPMPRYAYIAPYRTQAKAIAWNYLKFYTAPFGEYRRVNETELSITLTSRHAGMPGAKICLHGADNPDSIRGTYWDGVILDEYAQMKHELWEHVVLPALSDRAGWAVFIGTPRGLDAFFDIYETAKRTPGWWAGMFRADETGVIPPAELEMLRGSMGDAAFRQELMCDFTASANDILIPIDLVAAACAKNYAPADISNAERVLGVDIARYGDDATAAVLRQGLVAFPPWTWRNLSNVEVADQVGQIIHERRPHAVFVDAGRGEGVIDILRSRGNVIQEVPFNGRAIDHARYADRATEMYDKCKKWLMENGSIPNDPRLRTELSARTYDFDTRGRMMLEPKKNCKTRLGQSPDVGDALALTFAAPVYGERDMNGRPRGRVIDY
jgi:hypothetical protein